MPIRDYTMQLGFLERKRPLSHGSFRAPEDQFSTDEQIARRHREPLRLAAVERAIASFMESWKVGDEVGARLSADEIKTHTRAHFQQQGVPVIASPVLPYQFVLEAAQAVRDLPKQEQEAQLDSVARQFGPDLAATVARELRPAILALERSGASFGNQPEAPAVRTAGRFGELSSGVFDRQPRSPLAAGRNGEKHFARNDREDRSRDRTPPSSTPEFCAANEAAWNQAAAACERLLKSISEVYRQRMAAKAQRLKFQREWTDGNHAPKVKERFHIAANKWLQVEQDLDAKERRLRNQLRQLDNQKIQIRERHKGCAKALPDDPHGLYS